MDMAMLVESQVIENSISILFGFCLISYNERCIQTRIVSIISCLSGGKLCLEI